MIKIEFNSIGEAFAAAMAFMQKGIGCKGYGKTLILAKNTPNDVMNEVFTTYPPKS